MSASCFAVHESRKRTVDQGPLGLRQGQISERGRIHFRLGHELHALVDVCVIGLIVAVKVVPTLGCIVIVVASSNIIQIVGNAGLANLEVLESVLPQTHGLVKGQTTKVVVASLVLVVVVASLIVVIVVQLSVLISRVVVITISNQKVAKNVLHSVWIITSLLLVLDGTFGIRVEASSHASLGNRLEIIIDWFSIGSGRPRIGTALRPFFSSIVHKGVLLISPNADTLVLEELFHPIVVGFVLEESQQRKVRTVQVTIHLGTSPASTLRVIARCLVPGVVVNVVVLIFSDAASFVTQVDVLIINQ